MLEAVRERTNGYTVTAGQYAVLARVALGALTLIVLTGAAVRLTGSGLGCPTWPKCYGNYYPPLNAHSVIEFSNRVVSVPVVLAAGFAWLGALRRRPYRRDLTWNAALLPLGVICQAVLGGLTVKGELDYGWVMAHFALSMLVLLAAVVLAWRSGHEFSEEDEEGEGGAADPASGGARGGGLALDRGLLRALIGLAALGALTIFAGTAATAAGPHAGGSPGQRINRLSFDGTGTMDFVIHRHGEIALAFALAAVGAWFLARRRRAPEEVRRPLTVLCWLLLVQGAVGLDQYETHLPAGLVWVHVCLATVSWLATLWAACAAGAADSRLWARGRRRGAQAPVRGVAPLEFPGN
jgi:cytochrome c oxidase assembly protein subunit 15